jgi:MoaA/NifB/PqqE/SkfB family radical SAM enzyme
MSNFYCAAPWRGLHINPRGDVKTCCAGDPNMLGNLDTHTITEILQGPVMQEIRQSIRNGKPHDYCYNCVQSERYGRSERNWHNEVNPDFNSMTATDLEHIPVLLDIRWNTTCNLSCNYCGDKCSSKWADLKKISFKSGARPYYEQVCAYINQHQVHIKEVALVGGEPLLLKENERLLDVIPNNCILSLITNLSVDLENNKIFQKLKNRQVQWSASFDNVGQQFEYVRHGGQWSQIEKNIKLITQLSGHKIGIHAVYSVYNATRLNEFIDWVRSQGIDIHWQSLYQPECLDPLRLGPGIQNLALLELQTALTRQDLTISERDFFEQALANNQSTSHPGLIKELQAHINEMELTYHKDQAGNFNKLWPELEKIVNTSYG